MSGKEPPTQTDQIIDAAARGEAVTEADRREQKRLPYASLVAVLLEGEEYERPIAVRAVDLSKGGMAVRCGPALPQGARGVAQLVRSDGRTALVGIVVRYCRYEGNGAHLVGLEFSAVPEQLSHKALDAQGRMHLLDPLLLENADPRR